MEYIQEQITTFYAGIFTVRSQIAPFTNMEGTVTAEDLRADKIH